MGTTPADVADFLWFVTAYIAALSVSYSLLRGAGMPGPRLEIGASPNAGWALMAIVALAAIYQIGIEHTFHVHLNPGYKELRQNILENKVVVQLPLFVGQITHNVVAIGQIAMLGIVAFVFARKEPAARSCLGGISLGRCLFDGFHDGRTNLFRDADHSRHSVLSPHAQAHWPCSRSGDGHRLARRPARLWIYSPGHGRQHF